MRFATQRFAPQGGNSPTLLSVRAGSVTSGIGSRLPIAGTIAGVVKNAAGQPVAGVCPFALRLTSQSAQENLTLSVTGQTVGSGSDGSYQITGLTAGKYAVGFASYMQQVYALGWWRRSARSSLIVISPLLTGLAGVGSCLVRDVLAARGDTCRLS